MTTEPEVIQWGCNYLSSQGYTLKSNLPEHVKDTPWSYLLRFATSDGYIYLKHTPHQLAFEAEIIQILRDKFHAPVAEVIAYNPELDCFLMKDAGRPLRVILKEKFDPDLYCKAIDQFTSMQIAVADHVKVFIDIGVPDWRLDKLSDLFRQLLSQKDVLITDGLSELEINELEKLQPKISSLCKKLSGYSIKQTIVQPDFHDNNLLVNDISKKITIIDLGEIVISHPLFSLINCLRQVKKHHSLTDDNDAYQQIRDTCLKNYMNGESKQNVLDALAIAEILLYVYGALAGYRLMIACGKEKLMTFQPGKFGDEFKALIAACNVSE